MGHQQIAVPIKPVGDYIPLMGSQGYIIRHIRECKVGTIIDTGTEIVEFIIIEFCQPCAALRVGKQPAFKFRLDLRLFLTGKDGFFFVQDISDFILAVFVHIVHPVLYLHKAEI